MSLLLLDTDHISLYLRNDQKIVEKFNQNSSQIVVSIISFQEVMNGWVGSLNQSVQSRDGTIYRYHQLWLASDFFKSLPIVEFDSIAYDRCFNLLSNNPQLQKKRLLQDVRIASIALSLDATVVTRNRRDFALVPGLKIEDWSI